MRMDAQVCAAGPHQVRRVASCGGQTYHSEVRGCPSFLLLGAHHKTFRMYQAILMSDVAATPVEMLLDEETRKFMMIVLIVLGIVMVMTA